MTGNPASPADWWKTVDLAEMRGAEHAINTALRAASALSADDCTRLARALAIHRLCFPDGAAQQDCIDAVSRMTQQARACMTASPPQWGAALQAQRGGENIAEALGRALELARVKPGTRAHAHVEACRLTMTVLAGEMRTFALGMPVVAKAMPRIRFKPGGGKV